MEWPLNIPQPNGYSTYEFTKDEQTKNCHRDYRIIYQPGLWSSHIIRRSWGRRGSKNFLFIDQDFDTQEVAVQFIKTLVIKRIKRGYKLSDYEAFS
jgi:predicted DNA-binding WGR domain protein